MKKKIPYNFMIRQFKRTFQALYLDEICYCLYLYVFIYGVIYTGNIYMVLIMQETILNRLGKVLDY